MLKTEYSFENLKLYFLDEQESSKDLMFAETFAKYYYLITCRYVWKLAVVHMEQQEMEHLLQYGHDLPLPRYSGSEIIKTGIKVETNIF